MKRISTIACMAFFLFLTGCADENTGSASETGQTSEDPCETMMCEFGCDDGTCLLEGSAPVPAGSALCETMMCEFGCEDGACLPEGSKSVPVIQDPCETMLCEFGCEDGKCLPGDPCEIMLCEFGCEDGVCIEDPNGCLPPCEAGSICVEGECLPGPCFEKTCGEICDPCDGAVENCPSIAVEFYCNAGGLCVEDLGVDECEGEEGGVSFCEETECEEGFICKDDQCVPVWDACAGKQCGDICPACDTNDPDCVPIEVELFCNAAGECVEDLEPGACEEEMDPCDVMDIECDKGFICKGGECVPGPCVEKSCGAVCDPCDGAVEACPSIAVEFYCNAGGQCVEDLGVDECEGEEGGMSFCEETGCEEGFICQDGQCVPVWDACAGKQCGDMCPACDINDPDCVPIEVELFCNAAGDCVPFLEEGECTEDCDITGCPEGYTCSEEGFCAEDDCNLNGCPAGFTCWYDTCVQVLPWEPCKTDGLVCGDPCEPCSPQDDSCDPDDVPYLCNADGECVDNLKDGDCPVTCAGNDDCLETEYCDFPDDQCGVPDLGVAGACATKPLTCFNPEGVGVCGCNGGVEANPCMLAMTGEDTFKFGGCDLGNGQEPEFECVDTTCSYQEHCTIIFEDGAGNGLGYDGFCEALGEGEEQGKCSSVPTGILDLFSFCTDETGFTVLFAL